MVFKPCSGVFVAVLISHASVSSLTTKIIARMQVVWIVASQCPVCNIPFSMTSIRLIVVLCSLYSSLCLGIIIGLPSATPKEFMNSAKYAFGNFDNGMKYNCLVFDMLLTSRCASQWMAQWLCIYPEFLGTFMDYWLATCRHRFFQVSFIYDSLAAFDSTLHISEEATNASVAVPWAMTLCLRHCQCSWMGYLQIIYLKMTLPA